MVLNLHCVHCMSRFLCQKAVWGSSRRSRFNRRWCDLIFLVIFLSTSDGPPVTNLAFIQTQKGAHKDRRRSPPWGCLFFWSEPAGDETLERLSRGGRSHCHTSAHSDCVRATSHTCSFGLKLEHKQWWLILLEKKRYKEYMVQVHSIVWWSFKTTDVFPFAVFHKVMVIFLVKYISMVI